MENRDTSKKGLLARIEELKSFVATAQYPSPTRMPGGRDIDDLFAVAAGTKPAGLASVNAGYSWRHVIETLEEAGVTVKTVQLWENGKWNNDLIAARNPDDLAAIEKLLNRSQTMNATEYHTQLGRLLGYPQEAIDAFNAKSLDQPDIKAFTEKYAESSSWQKARGEAQKLEDSYKQRIANNPKSGLAFAAAEVGIGASLAWNVIKSPRKKESTPEKPAHSVFRNVVQGVTGVVLMAHGVSTGVVALKGDIVQRL